MYKQNFLSLCIDSFTADVFKDQQVKVKYFFYFNNEREVVCLFSVGNIVSVNVDANFYDKYSNLHTL